MSSDGLISFECRRMKEFHSRYPVQKKWVTNKNMFIWYLQKTKEKVFYRLFCMIQIESKLDFKKVYGFSTILIGQKMYLKESRREKVVSNYLGFWSFKFLSDKSNIVVWKIKKEFLERNIKERLANEYNNTNKKKITAS